MSRTAKIFLLGVTVSACGQGGGSAQPDPDRQRYEADKARCEQTSSIEAARKSCMSYRGWPDGKFRR